MIADADAFGGDHNHAAGSCQSPQGHQLPSRSDRAILAAGTHYLAALSIGVLPPEAAPLYSLLAGVLQALADRPAYPAILASAQLARALQILGFEAELVPACTVVVDSIDASVIDIGVWEHPPAVNSDGSTDGHAIVWSESFKRCIDLAPCNLPALRDFTGDDTPLNNPIVLEVREGKERLFEADSRSAILRGSHAITWLFFPRWNLNLQAYLELHSSAIERGSEDLANVAIDLLSSLQQSLDLSPSARASPKLVNLITAANGNGAKRQI